MEKVRIDKWLWAVRLYKTRTLASNACKGNKVKINGIHARAGKSLLGNETVEISKKGINYSVIVQKLISKRVGVTLAQECYIDITPDEERNKRGQSLPEAFYNPDPKHHKKGRPTKKDRRDMDSFKGS